MQRTTGRQVKSKRRPSIPLAEQLVVDETVESHAAAKEARRAKKKARRGGRTAAAGDGDSSAEEEGGDGCVPAVMSR